LRHPNFKLLIRTKRVVAIGIVRTVELVRISTAWDVMWKLYTVWIWTIIELDLAIMAASAPALKCFFQSSLVEPSVSLYRWAKSSRDGDGDAYSDQ
jgi:hypothetical protein